MTRVSSPKVPKSPRSFGSILGPNAGDADISLHGLIFVSIDSSDVADTDAPVSIIIRVSHCWIALKDESVSEYKGYCLISVDLRRFTSVCSLYMNTRDLK